jgi:hypothetical protein
MDTNKLSLLMSSFEKILKQIVILEKTKERNRFRL